MATPQWPKMEKRALLGKRISRLDGPVKATGQAKYAYDMNRPGMLYARCCFAPYGAMKINGIDASAAEKAPGVRAVLVEQNMIGDEVRYVGQILATVAADTEEQAHEALRLIKVDFERLDMVLDDMNPANATGKPSGKEEGTVDDAMAAAKVVSEGEYGIPVITHCCLEAHGQVSEFKDGEMTFWPSTQSVSAYAEGMDQSIEVEQSKIHVDCQYMGGGFGSKFSHDQWGVIGALLSKQTGRPVKLMLERDQELMVAGNRPSAFGKVRVAVSPEGKMTAIDADVWGTGGNGGYRMPPVPYVFEGIPNVRNKGQGIKTNRGSQRAWRAPSHPQGCFITMAAVEDAAAAAGIDALEFFKNNLDLTSRPEVYAEQLDIAAELIGYKTKAHLRGQGEGPVRRGIGISIHTWGGMGHPSNCDAIINPDGSVEIRLGTQDLGSGTRTVVGIVAAETYGLPLEAITVSMGNNKYPFSSASGGSTTVGGVSSSTRIACTNALNALLEVVAPRLGVAPEALEVAGGKIFESAKPGNSIAWKDACGLMGPNPITKQGANEQKASQDLKLIDAGVGGVQMADVSVDIETGVVTLNEMVAVQDCGLIVDLKTAESQVYGGLIMGITYALYEEALYNHKTGRMLNGDLEFYRLAGLKDIGQLKVHMMTTEKYDSRGVIGLGEPPVISPGAAISNAVANAAGVRVPHLPLTPERVIVALQKGGILV